MSEVSQTGPSPDDQLSVQSRVLEVSKEGVGTDEYEDATAVREEGDTVRAAVADGATEAAFAGVWADILVDGLVSIAATPEALVEALPDWQAAWAEALDDRTEPLPWYGAAKAREGAFATLIGLELQRDGRWRAVSVGDGLLVHLRQDTVHRTWPYTTPAAFTNRPALLPSRPDRPSPTAEDCRAVTGRWQVGDAFLLATDAVGAWLLRAERDDSVSDERPTPPAAARTWSEETFRAAVTEARAEGHLRNDDSTLLVLEPNDPSAPDP